jgi:hypothetical protein
LDLLRDYLDLEDPKLTDLVEGLFDESKLGRRNVEVRGAALVGFSLANYQFPLEEDRTTATKAVADLLKRCHQRAGLKISENELSEFVLEIFFVPFPDVEAFRTELRSQLGLPPKEVGDER